MKRIFSILFAVVLVLSFSLIPAMPVMATGTTTTLSIPDNVYRPAPFDASSTTTNDGTAYDNVRFNITVSGPEAFTGAREDIFTITHLDGSTNTQGINDTFVLVGEDFIGGWGPEVGFGLTDPYDVTSVFTVQMNDGGTAPVGNYHVTVDLVDLTPDPDFTLASATSSFTLSADTLHVGAGQQFTTIQDAIDAAEPGDTIIVAAGTYNEAVLINKSLTLQAASSPVIDGGGMLGPGVHITAADVTFQGFTVTNFTCTPSSGVGGIWVEGDRAIINDNTIYNIVTTGDPIANPAGIGIDVAATDVEVTGNLVYDVGSIGIRVRSRYMEDGEAVPAALETGILVEGNTVHDTGNTGVLVAGHLADVTIKGNVIYDSLPPTPYSLWILGTSNLGAPSGVAVEGNTISGGYGNVHVYGASNIDISGNTISGAIPHYTNSAIKGKNIYIRAGSANINITNNNITGADGWGILILDTGFGEASDDITIHHNTVTDNSEDGISVAEDSDSIHHNTVTDNGGDGIKVAGDSDSIHFNTVTDNDGYGIHLTDTSHDNKVHHNTLSGNTVPQINDEGTDNKVFRNDVS